MKSAFAKKLSRLRCDKGLSQRCAAADLGVSQALLSHYENGAREPKLDFVIRACDYYGVTADYILGRSGKRVLLSLRANDDYENTPRITRVASNVSDSLNKLSDPELYAAAVDYIVIPIENVAALLSDPDAQYDPSRDAELKMAEAAFLSKARLLCNGKPRQIKKEESGMRG